MPWDGRAEKSLQIALMDEDKETIKNTMFAVIDECTYNVLDIENLPDVDIDWIITQLRTKSVGEIVELVANCPSCEKQYDIGINLMEALVVDTTLATRNKPIKIDDDIYFNLQLPSKQNYSAYLNDKSFTRDHLIASMIISVSTSEETFSASDYSKQQLVEYVEVFNKKKKKLLYEYVDNLPRVTVSTKCKCRHCGTEQDIALEGTEFFFVWC